MQHRAFHHDQTVPYGTIQPATTRPQPNHSGGVPNMRIGDLLVRQGVLTPQQVAHVLDVQAVVGRPFGELAEQLFDVPPIAVDAAWAQQLVALHGARDVSRERFDAGSVALLNARQAWQFRLVPLRRELTEDEAQGHLLVATDRERLRRAIAFATRTLPLAPTFVVATRSSLTCLLERAYPVSAAFGRWAAGE